MQVSRRLFVAGGMVLPMLAGCNPTNDETISIGMVTFPGYAPFYVADRLKLFKGIKVNLLRIESIGDLRSALQSGRIDAYLATFDIYQAIEGRAPIGKIIYAIDQSVGADGVAGPDTIADVSEFVGKRVGVEPGFPPHFVLTYALYKRGIKLSQLDVVEMPSGDVSSAYAANQIDIAATYEPYLSNCLQVRAGSKVIVSSADTPSLITDFIVASDEALGKKANALRALIAGWEAALVEIKKDPAGTNSIMGEAFNVPAAEMEEFAKVVQWLGANENQAIFSGGSNSLAVTRFAEVNEALRLNNPAVFASTASDSILYDFVKT